MARKTAKRATQAKDTRPVRAVTLPVAELLGGSWDDLRASLRRAWDFSTALANWAVHYLFRRDTPGERETPAAVKERNTTNPDGAYLYGAAGTEFPGWDERSEKIAASGQCVLRAVQRKYLQDRFGFMVSRRSSLLTYHYPYPFPVHKDTWQPSYDAGGFPVVTLPLPGLGRVSLRLKRRADFGRQLAMFKAIHDGVAAKGEAAIYQNRKGDVLVKLVGRFPRRERGPATNVAFVHTDPNAMLVVEVNGRRANVTNGDHIRRAIARHRTMLQRTREDKKRELRMDRRHRANLNKYVAERCGKQNDRLKTFVKQIAAQVARMCERQGVGLVAFDDANKAFMPDGFPWHALKERLSQLVVGEMGCGWIDGQFAHLSSPEEKDQWLARARASLSAARKVIAHKSRPASRSHPAVSAPPKTTR